MILRKEAAFGKGDGVVGHVTFAASERKGRDASARARVRNFEAIVHKLQMGNNRESLVRL